MRNSCLVFLLFLFANVSAQDTLYKIACTYKLDYQSDSTDILSKKSEDMLLLINNRNSVFRSKNACLRDSAENVMTDINAYLKYTASISTSLNYSVIKDTSSEIKYLDYIDNVRYEYKEPRNTFYWNIKMDTATICGFKCQKATTYFGGREWTAWFTSEISIDNGPYKFCGLPGLIIKVSDQQGFFTFTLTELRIRSGKIFLNSRKTQSIEKVKFYKSLNYFKQNQFEMMQARGMTITSGAESIRKRIEERNKKNNNPIELIK